MTATESRALPDTQRALLWCIRMWVLELSRGITAEPQIDDMLETLGVPEMAPALHDMMDALSTSCTRMIDVRCICEPRLSADERTLLDILSLAQQFEPVQARTLLASFVTPAGAERVLVQAETIGTALVQAGHSLPSLDTPRTRHGLSILLATLPRAHATIH